jgi:SAM-dependent methyltransferase
MSSEAYRCPVCGSRRYSYAFSALRQVYRTADLKDRKNFVYISCDSCGFIWQRDPLSDTELAQCYEDDSYVVNSSRLLEYVMSRYYDIARHLKKNRENRLLDIGAGDGAYLAYARRRGWQVLGCDISRYARDIALSKRNIRVVSMEEVESLPDKYFDLITLYHVLEHLAEPSRIFSLIRRKLKDGGVCVIMIPVADSLEQAIFKGQSAWVSAPYHLGLYSEKNMQMLAGNNNFKIKRVCNDWYTPSMFSFSIFELLQRRLGFFMPLGQKKLAAILLLPFLLPVFIFTALLGKGALKSFYLKHG